jgi:hypothetical protein
MTSLIGELKLSFLTALSGPTPANAAWAIEVKKSQEKYSKIIS